MGFCCDWQCLYPLICLFVWLQVHASRSASDAGGHRRRRDRVPKSQSFHQRTLLMTPMETLQESEELLSSRDPNNLNRNLLLANTSVKVMKLSVDMRIGTEEDSSSSDESEDSPLAKIAGKMPAKKAAAYKPSWIKNDLKESDAKSKFPWNLSAPKSDEQKSPVSLFESFFTPQLMDHRQRN